TGLLAGTWSIDRGTFTQYQDEVASWLGVPVAAPAVDRALAEAVEWLWARRGTSGRGAVRLASVDLALLWRPSVDETLALVVGPTFQQRQWFRAIQTASADGGLRVALATDAGPVYGPVADPHGPATFRLSSSETNLPWDVMVVTDDAASIGAN